MNSDLEIGDIIRLCHKVFARRPKEAWSHWICIYADKEKFILQRFNLRQTLAKNTSVLFDDNEEMGGTYLETSFEIEFINTQENYLKDIAIYLLSPHAEERNFAKWIYEKSLLKE